MTVGMIASIDRGYKIVTIDGIKYSLKGTPAEKFIGRLKNNEPVEYTVRRGTNYLSFISPIDTEEYNRKRAEEEKKHSSLIGAPVQSSAPRPHVPLPHPKEVLEPKAPIVPPKEERPSDVPPEGTRDNNRFMTGAEVLKRQTGKAKEPPEPKKEDPEENGKIVLPISNITTAAKPSKWISTNAPEKLPYMSDIEMVKRVQDNFSYWNTKAVFDIQNSKRIGMQACLNTATTIVNASPNCIGLGATTRAQFIMELARELNEFATRGEEACSSLPSEEQEKDKLGGMEPHK